jgi:hypothetical protein
LAVISTIEVALFDPWALSGLRTTKAFTVSGRGRAANRQRKLLVSARGSSRLPDDNPSTRSSLRLWSERPLILLVTQIAFVQAPSYLLAHRGIGCCGDNDAVLCDDLAASCLDREVF